MPYMEQKKFLYISRLKKMEVIAYDFVDIWKLLNDFNEEVEKVRRGIIQ